MKKRLTDEKSGVHVTGHSPAQAWLSLARMLLSSASLRFTKRHDSNGNCNRIKTSRITLRAVPRPQGSSDE